MRMWNHFVSWAGPPLSQISLWSFRNTNSALHTMQSGLCLTKTACPEASLPGQRGYRRLPIILGLQQVHKCNSERRPNLGLKLGSVSAYALSVPGVDLLPEFLLALFGQRKTIHEVGAKEHGEDRKKDIGEPQSVERFG